MGGAVRPRMGPAVGGAILAGLLAVQVAAAQYPGRKFVNAVGNPNFTADQIGFGANCSTDVADVLVNLLSWKVT